MAKLIQLMVLCGLLQANLFGQNQNSENVPAPNTSLLPLPKGPTVLGVFDGRTPCQGIARALNEKTIPECIKIKWRLILYQDAVTHAPTTFSLEGFVYKNPPRTGKWRIVKGTRTNPSATVYQLDTEKPDEAIYLYKGDDNVLFFLDKKKNFMVGDNNFSYTLNRTRE
ncbi:hypothetical protein [Niabella aquatica]